VLLGFHVAPSVGTFSATHHTLWRRRGWPHRQRSVAGRKPMELADSERTDHLQWCYHWCGVGLTARPCRSLW